MEVQAVVYTSHTGFTARYAAMLAESAGLPCFSMAEAEQLPAGAPVLYLGWIRAGGLVGFRRAARRWDIRAACAVGMAPAEQAGEIGLAARLRQKGVPVFRLRGGYAPERLAGRYRLMMTPIVRAAAKKPAETGEQRAVRDAFVQGGNWVQASALEPVLAWLRGA